MPIWLTILIAWLVLSIPASILVGCCIRFGMGSE
jgi:hypothetical protein